MKKKTDFRQLRAKRESALNRPELVQPPKPQSPDAAAIAACMASGRFTKLPPARRRRYAS